MIRDFIQDLRLGVRSLRKSPGFAATVVLSLAVGIGANAAIFGAVDALLLRPLPVRAPHELVALSRGLDRGVWGEPQRRAELYSHPLYQRLRKDLVETGLLAGLAAQQSARFGAVVRWKEGEPPADLAGARAVSGDFFAVLGVPAQRGRTFAADDDRAGAPAVAVISHGYWQRRFGGDPQVLGAPLSINAGRFTVVGILPPGFSGAVAGDRGELWVPLAQLPQIAQDRNILSSRALWWLHLVGRRAPGVDLAAVQAAANVSLQRFLAEGPFRASEVVDPDPEVPRTAADVRIELIPGAHGFSGMRGTLRGPLLVLMTGAALLLVIVALNVSHLMLARALQRRREMSIRAALGASGGRLARQLLAEGLLLAGLGGLLGLLCERPIVDALVALGPGAPDLELPAHPRTWGLAAVLTLAIALLLAVLPALEALRATLHRTLSASAPALTVGRVRRWGARVLLVSQVAVSLVLLVGAGLLATSLGRLRGVDNGLDRRHVLVAQVLPRELGLTKPEALPLYDRLIERVAALPGVRAASMSGIGGTWLVSVPPRPPTVTSVNKLVVTPGHFRAVGMTLLQGRDFDRGDRAGAPPVAILNRALARQLFGEGPALGRRFRTVAAPEVDLEVVGIVSDARLFDVRAVPPAAFYLPAAQDLTFLRRLEVRAHGDPAALAEAVRRAIGEVSASLPVASVRTMDEQLAANLSHERLLATLAAAFGVVALFLVCVGLHGVISHWATQRTRELGLRLALGSTAGGVRWLVLRQALGLVLVGVAIGIPAALAAARVFQGLLFGVTALHAPALLLGALVLPAVGLLAAYLPARRASRLEPMTALRVD